MDRGAGTRTAALAATLAPILALTLGFPGNVDPTALAISTACLICGYYGSADFLLNIALFVPFGMALRFAGRRPRQAAAIGFALSATIELIQLGIPGRYTTLGDLAANTSGTLLGALLMGPGALALLSPPSRRRQVVLTLLVAAAWVGSAAAFSPSLPHRPYYGQWTARLGQYEAYEGEVVATTLARRTLPSWRLQPEGAAREALLAGDTVRVTAVAGPPPPGPAPIFSIYDDHQREILFLGADGDDLVLKLRRRAADLRLASPELRWRHALRDIEVGDTLRLAAWREGRAGACIRFGTDQRCGAPAIARGWTLLRESDTVPAGVWPALDALWLGSGAGLALAWAPALGAGAVGAGVLIAVLGVTAIVVS